jgi:hypothetical protein
VWSDQRECSTSDHDRRGQQPATAGACQRGEDAAPTGERRRAESRTERDHTRPTGRRARSTPAAVGHSGAPAHDAAEQGDARRPRQRHAEQDRHRERHEEVDRASHGECGTSYHRLRPRSRTASTVRRRCGGHRTPSKQDGDPTTEDRRARSGAAATPAATEEQQGQAEGPASEAFPIDTALAGASGAAVWLGSFDGAHRREHRRARAGPVAGACVRRRAGRSNS